MVHWPRKTGRGRTASEILRSSLPVFEAFVVADQPAIILGLDWLAETRLVIDFPARRVCFLPLHRPGWPEDARQFT